MQALRKAERARSQHGHDGANELPQFGAESLPSPPPIEGGPAFAVMPDAWHLEPLDAALDDAEPPVVAAQEAAHDPVPPQARHQPARAWSGGANAALNPAAAPSRFAAEDATPAAPEAAPRASATPAGDAARAMRGAGVQAGAPARAVASPQRRLLVLASALAVLLAVFAFIYWRALSGPGPGARLPMVPMPAPGSPPLAQAGVQPGAAIPVTPYVTAPAGETAPQAGPSGIGAGAATEAVPATAPTGPGTTAQGARAAAAPATMPKSDVTIPTPEQLAAIPDPAIRAEAMRDAAERAARQVRAESAPPAAAPRASAQQAKESAPPSTAQAPEPRRPASPQRGGPSEIRTAVGENGEVQFVRGAAAPQVAPAVQQGYQALKSGDLATARQQYDTALMQDPNNRDALLGAAAVALREHDGRQAANDYLRLLELDPNDPEALAGLAELRPGELQANETRLRGLARQHPESGPVQFTLGNLFARQGRWPEAQQSYFRAFSAMPENADYAFNLGVGLDRMNQPRLAQTYYRRALELAHTSAPGFDPDAVRKRLQALETPPR